MQRRIRSLALLATAAMIPLAACSASPDGAPAAGGTDIVALVAADQKSVIEDVRGSLGAPVAGPDTKLCYITRTLANEYWGFETAGFEAEAQRVGVRFQTFAVNDESSITEQLDKARSALNQGCSAILASPISATALDGVFSTALAQGIPAIVLNDAKGTLPGVVYVGPDAEEIGRTAADYIAEQLPDGGQVAMIEGDPGSSNALNRGKGFRDGLTAHPDLELVASQSARWDTNQAQTIATAMLTANPGIRAFYSQNDTMAFGVQAAIDARGLTGQVIIVGTDGIPQAKRQIEGGTVTATVSERPTTEGAAGVSAALWLLAGKQVPAWIDVPAFIVDRANVADHADGMP